MIKSLLILALGCLIVLGVYAADGIRQVIGGTDTVGSIGLANLPVGVVTNGYTPIFTNTTIKLGSGAFNSPAMDLPHPPQMGFFTLEAGQHSK